MKGAIFYATKYGSTAQYARWISDATGLPVFDINQSDETPRDFDFLILGGSILYFKLINAEWMKRHAAEITGKPTILFTVSGASAGPKLDSWIADSLTPDLVAHVDHVALRGRQSPKDLTWFDRIALIIAGKMNKDRKAAKEETQGFDFMDKSSIAPIIDKVARLNADPPFPRAAAADPQAAQTPADRMPK